MIHRGELLATRVSIEERNAIRRIARENDRTSSVEVRRAIRFYLANPAKADRYLRQASGGKEKSKL